MSTNFPAFFDSFVNPLAGQPLNNPDQATLIGNLNDAVIALQDKVGIDSSVNVNSIDYKVNHVVRSVRAGTNVVIDNTDPNNPIVSSTGGGSGPSGGVTSVRGGANISVDSTNTTSPIVSVTGLLTSLTAGSGMSITNLGTGNPVITNTGLLGVTAGANISVGTGANPTISATGVVLSVAAGAGISITGSATHPVVNSTSGASTTTPTFNVLDYGADKTGASDSTNAIIAAIAAASTSGGGIVFFPAGQYLVSSQINISSPWITLVGVDTWNNIGSGSKIVMSGSFATTQLFNITANGVTIRNLGIQGSTATHPINVAGTVGTPISGITLKDLYIYGVSGINVNYANSIVLDNITPVHWSGTSAFNITNSQDVFFNKCIPTNFNTGATYGFYTSACTRVDYENCEVQDASLSYCVYANTTTHSNIDGFIVTGPANFIDLNSCNNWNIAGIDFSGTGKGVNITSGGYNISVADSSLLSTTDIAINIDGTASPVYYVGVVNCNIEQSGSSTANLISMNGNVYAITINANRFTNVGTNLAIYDNSTSANRYCVYSGNTFYPGGINSLSIVAGTNVITNGNSGYPTSLNGVQISATPPSSGQILTASSATKASWQPANYINGVLVSSTPGSPGQLLTATGANSASWQNAPSGGGGASMDLLAGSQIVITNPTSATPTIATVGLVHTITAGTNVSITGTATDPIISATGGGGGAGKIPYYAATPGLSPAAINTNTYSTVRWINLNSDITINTSPTAGGPPYDGDTLSISLAQITGTPFNVYWGTMFQSSYYQTLPNATIANNRIDIGFIWNATDLKWRCVSVS